MNKPLIALAALLAASAPAQVLTTNPQAGHVVYGKHGSYTCQPIGATCAVKDIKKPQTAKTDWPKIVSAHIVLDSVQAKLPGNEHVKPCGQTGPNETCWDASLRHIVNHLYGSNKAMCEKVEGVPCTELMSFSQSQWVPIGKPVFEDKTPEPETLLWVGLLDTEENGKVLNGCVTAELPTGLRKVRCAYTALTTAEVAYIKAIATGGYDMDHCCFGDEDAWLSRCLADNEQLVNTAITDRTEWNWGNGAGFGDIAEAPSLTTQNGGKLAEMARVTGSGKMVVAESFVGNVSIESQTGRVERLTTAEYDALKKLRQGVSDLEFQIAVAHGIDLGQAYKPATCIAMDMGSCMVWNTDEVKARLADRYEFRGQFLLINLPESAK